MDIHFLAIIQAFLISIDDVRQGATVNFIAIFKTITVGIRIVQVCVVDIDLVFIIKAIAIRIQAIGEIKLERFV